MRLICGFNFLKVNCLQIPKQAKGTFLLSGELKIPILKTLWYMKKVQSYHCRKIENMINTKFFLIVMYSPSGDTQFCLENRNIVD